MIKHLLLAVLLLFMGCSRKDKEVEPPTEETTPEWMGDKAQDSKEIEEKEPPKKEVERIVQTEHRPIQSQIDSVRSHLADSAQQVRDSLRLQREKELEAQRQEKREKAEFINKVYDQMWADGQSALDYLAVSRTATQVRAEAQNYRTKAAQLRTQMKDFKDGDPRKKALSDHLNLVEMLSTRLPQTGGISRKMDILRVDITETLNRVSKQGDIIID